MIDDFEHACRDKSQYSNKQRAIDAMRNIELSNRNRLRFGIGNYKNKGKLNVYFCKFCGFWHIGHKGSEI